MSKRTILVLLIGIAVMTAVVFAYRQIVTPHPRGGSSRPSATPTTTSTPAPASSQSPLSWATYINGTYQYRIEYPSTGRLTESTGRLDEHSVPRLQETSILFAQEFETDGGGRDEFGFSITIYDNPATLTSQHWALQQWNADVIRKQQEIIVSGLPGYELKVFEIDRTGVYIYLSTGMRLYKISYWDPDSMIDFPVEVRKSYAAIFQRMVDSFKIQIPSASQSQNR